MADTNVVLSGLYAGNTITYLTNSDGQTKVYIKENNKSISKNTVSSIEVINAESDNKALEGAILGGIAGAVVGSSIKDMIVKVTWIGGGTSIMKVRSGMYDYMVVSAQFYEITKTEKEAEQKSDFRYKIALFILAIIYIIVYGVMSSD